MSEQLFYKPKHEDILDFYPYEKLSQALRRTREVYSSKQHAQNFVEYSNRIVDGIHAKSGLKPYAAIGLGYPFYLLSPEMPDKFELRTYEEFTDITQQKLDHHISQDGKYGWMCTGCQEAGNLPDLKTLCKPCNRVQFKPRDIFKAVPDVDMVVVMPTTDDNLARVSAACESLGVRVSDSDIRGSIDYFLSGVDTNIPENYVLVDLHVMNQNVFESSLQSVEEGVTSIKAPVISYRGKGNWDSTEQLPFWLDVVESATPLGENLDGNRSIFRALTTLATNNCVGDLMAELQKQREGEKGERMYGDPLARNLIEKSLQFRLNYASGAYQFAQ